MSSSASTNFHSCVSHHVRIPHIWKVSANKMEAMMTQRRSTHTVLLSIVDGDGWLTPCPAPFTLWNNQVTVAEWARGRYGRVWEFLPPPAFEPCTVQPVPSLCTDYTIPAHRNGEDWVNTELTKSLVTLTVTLNIYFYTKYHTTNKCTNCMSFILKSLF